MALSLHTPVCDLLGCRYPIVLAGMGGVARSELVNAVTKAGGFGFLGMVRESPALIRKEVALIRQETDRDFGVNLIPAATESDLLEAQVATCIDLKVPVIGLFWNLSVPLVERLRRAGTIIICQVGTLEEAIAAQTAGAHAVIAQGVEAGGHIRGKTKLFPLLSEVIPNVTIPVLAAGGIVDGKDLATVLTMGAQGAVLGTAFLATEESFAHDYHKRRIVEANAADTVLTDVFHINWPWGTNVRVLASSVTIGERGDPFLNPKQIIGDESGRAIYLFSTDSPLRSTTGDFEAMALYAGEGCGRIEGVVTAGERLRTIVSEAIAIPGTSDNSQVTKPESPEFSSPACLARDADASYMGYFACDELIAFLNEMLETERAGARVTLRTALETSDLDIRRLAAALYHTESRWCERLSEAIRAVQGEPSERIGSFYKEAMAISDCGARLSFHNRGQGWIIERLRKTLPKIRDRNLYDELSAMLISHEQNIAMVTVSGLSL